MCVDYRERGVNVTLIPEPVCDLARLVLLLCLLACLARDQGELSKNGPWSKSSPTTWLSGDGFGSTLEMSKQNLLWVVSQMQVIQQVLEEHVQVRRPRGARHWAWHGHSHAAPLLRLLAGDLIWL